MQYLTYPILRFYALGPGYYEPERYDGGLVKKSYNVLASRPENAETTNIAVSPMRFRSTRSADSPLHVSRAQGRKIKDLLEAATSTSSKIPPDACDSADSTQTESLNALTNEEYFSIQSRRTSYYNTQLADSRVPKTAHVICSFTTRDSNNDTTQNKLSRSDMRKMLTFLRKVS